MDAIPLQQPREIPRTGPASASHLLLVSSMYTPGDLARRLGRDAYSYRYVFEAFAPHLARWGQIQEVALPVGPRGLLPAGLECQPDSALHMSFLPLHLASCIPGLANVGVPAWEFPDLPRAVPGEPADQDWVEQARRMDLLITHTRFSQAAFLRAGVRTPVHVVPVPTPSAYFELPAWEPGQQVVLDCPCYIFPQPPQLPPAPRSWVAANTGHLPARPGLRGLYKRVLQTLPGDMGQSVHKTARAVRAGLWSARAVLHEQDVRQLYPPRSRLQLSGIVYTTILNPFDGRKNWTDLLSGFLLALRDCDDAMLVVKLVVSGDWEAAALADILSYYRSIGIGHRCKLVFVTAYLAESQLVELARASTYYLNTSRAEGSCLPLQNFMAARRPALAPPHTGMADSLDERCAYLLQSHPEPTCWPHQSQSGMQTTWHRLVWQSLYDQLRASYRVARDRPAQYRARGEAARRRMQELVSGERIWPQLETALNAAVAAYRGRVARSGAGHSRPLRHAV